MAYPIKCSKTLIHDLYLMDKLYTVQDILNIMKRYSEEGAEIIITDNYTNAHTRQEEENELHRLRTPEELEQWAKSTFPKLYSSEEPEASDTEAGAAGEH